MTATAISDAPSADAATAGRLIDAMTAAAREASGGAVALVSASCDFAGGVGDADVTARVDRKTRSIAFVSAEARRGGAVAASATGVYRLVRADG